MIEKKNPVTTNPKPTRESIKHVTESNMESHVDKQKLAQKISKYASLQSTGDRLKFIQENLDENKTGKGTLINQITYIYPKKATQENNQ